MNSNLGLEGLFLLVTGIFRGILIIFSSIVTFFNNYKEKILLNLLLLNSHFNFQIRNLLAPMDMNQFYPLYPSKGYSLDLLFSNLVVEGYEVVDPLARYDEHHIPVVFMFEACIINTINVDRIIYNFNKSNVQGIVNTS